MNTLLIILVDFALWVFVFWIANEVAIETGIVSNTDRRWRILKLERITRGDGDLYLWRFVILQCPLFAIMYHRFYQSDDDCLHDHPWPFISIILTGGYNEYEPGKDPVFRKPLHVYYRPATHTHRVELIPGKIARTLVITGPRTRKWGFHTPGGWVYYRDYDHDRHCIKE